MKKIIIILAIISLVLIVGCEKPIGGERDEHGCLGPAGYTWNEDVNACIREWELNENQKEAAKIAVENVGYTKGLTILEVMVARCPGCFAVKLEKDNKRIDVNLENWLVVSTPETEKLTLEEAMAIAEDSECTEKATLTDTYIYNENSKTFWIDIDMMPEFENELCYPACVVSEETKTAEINWRCTGALPE